MEIEKVPSKFNQYKAMLSFGELVALERVLAKDHAGPILDELYASVKWHLDQALPAPGQKKEDLEKEEGEVDDESFDFDGLDDAEPPDSGAEAEDDDDSVDAFDAPREEKREKKPERSDTKLDADRYLEAP